MAAAAPFLSADGYTCSVCLEVLKEPVTIPCGHSFCLECINSYWDRSGLMETYRCPQCRMEFHSRPQLHKNTTLMNLIEKLKETAAIRGPPQGTAGRNDVLCDFCPVRKRRASKTCLTCTASYCKIHLQPHLDSAAFMRHKLLEPTGNLKEKLCSKHQKVLDMFCRTDKSRICLLCAVTEHNSHNVRMLDKETTERKCQSKRRKAAVEKMNQEKEKKLEEMIQEKEKKLEEMIQEKEKKLEEVKDTLAKIQFLTSLRLGIAERIRDRKEKEVRKAEILIKQAESHIENLKMTNAAPPQTNDLNKFSHVNEDRSLLFHRLSLSLSDLKKVLDEISSGNFLKTTELNTTDRTELLKYSFPLTLDPNTANRWLKLSEENRKVTFVRTMTGYPDHPDRFDGSFQVLGKEGLSESCFYWEVEWRGERVEIGVTYKGIGKKQWSDKCLLGLNDKSWSLSCSYSSFSVSHDSLKIQFLAPFSRRIGVFLDCIAGSLSFYSVSDTATLMYRFNPFFTGPLYPGFWVSPYSSVTICPLYPFKQ
ncbi:E3 ubiquitin/ISG15 ligase TRIM25-like [Polypterus senegalus]|uniref:E3 ubiquitin/ISG15 ligase TRIM25-like n=1 Tax=Polypterus senegalus TaxID=55291 RepID=UPI001963BEF5|nr:E3 ubiquitin/ISG15 ligase TRIM25-like [Polypterus senegalus]